MIMQQEKCRKFCGNYTALHRICSTKVIFEVEKCTIRRENNTKLEGLKKYIKKMFKCCKYDNKARRPVTLLT